MKRTVVHKNDVLLNITGASIGRISTFEIEKVKANVNQHVCIIRSIPELLDHRYLLHFIAQPKFQNQINSTQHGGTRQALTFPQIRNFQILLPPLEEQRRIAAILDKADEVRRKRKEAIALTEDLLRSAFLEMFGDPVTNPKGWEKKPLEEVVHPDTIVTYGIVQAGPEIEDGVPYIRTGDIKNGQIVESNLLRTAPEIAQKFKRSEVHTGDLVMSIRATVGTIAKVLPSLNGANLTQGTAKISPGPNVQGNYLLWFIRSNGCQDWIQRQVKGATFREITLKRLREMPVMLPPLSLQSKFDQLVKQLKATDRNLQNAESEKNNLFNSLLQRAFRGEL
jgi:type I restriction enzyme, S subunit